MTKEQQSPLLIEPQDEASFEEWQEWALKLRDKVEKLTLEEKKRVTQLRGLRKELKKKNKVLGIYKQTIRELEEQV